MESLAWLRAQMMKTRDSFHLSSKEKRERERERERKWVRYVHLSEERNRRLSSLELDRTEGILANDRSDRPVLDDSWAFLFSLWSEDH